MPQQGRLSIATELAMADVEAQEIAVNPRGIRFQVHLPAWGRSARTAHAPSSLQLPPDFFQC
ncbi:hypothetical protein ASF77_02730 [Massilia sp. Leaf139]|nr:hypothetical protein ASF77_02730 [Massilia sp. Leaf139]